MGVLGIILAISITAAKKFCSIITTWFDVKPKQQETFYRSFSASPESSVASKLRKLL